jgi:uncharacterized protein (DUF1697 family)
MPAASREPAVKPGSDDASCGTIYRMPTRMVALLRGINVGGNKLIDMARLRVLLGDLGHTDVRTYLQSGNAVFSCQPKAVADAATGLENAIAGEFGVDCRVIVRTAAEFSAAMSADPLLHLLGNPSRHLVGFLSESPRPEGVNGLTSQDYGVDQLRIIDQHLYLWCPNGITGSPFGKLSFDRMLGAAVTMRNWNTVTKLATLLGE